MTPPEPTTQTVIVPINLGAASKYEEDIFPRAYHKAGDAMSKGSFLLTATLEEMSKIAEMGIDLNTDKRFRDNTRTRLETSANVRIIPVDILMCYWQSRRSGSKFDKSS